MLSKLTSLLLLLGAVSAAVWPARNAETLRDAVATADAGDVIELESGDYILKSPLYVNRPLTLRSRNRLARAVLRSASPDALLFVVAASQVSLTDFIVGAQTSGISDERSLDIYIGAGTQLQPIGDDSYNGQPNRRRRSPALVSRAEIAVARAVQVDNSAALLKRSVLGGDELRALHDIVVRNVDFSNSRSGANIAFALGAYSSVRVEQCTFGRRGASHINALVSVGGARFAGLAVQRNTFAGSSHILLGDVDLAREPNAIGINYWPEALEAENGHEPPVYVGGSRHVPTTYCLEATCTSLAPIVDANKPSAAYASLASAVAAGVRHILLTDDVSLEAPVPILLANTVIEGTRSANKAPLITVRSGGALVSRNGALAGIRNVRFALVGTGAAAIVYTDGSAETLAAAPFAASVLASVPTTTAGGSAVSDVVLFDGVSLMGDDSAEQVALVISAPGVRVELEDSVIVQTAIGVLVHRGALAMLDTTVFGAKRSGVLIETSTRRAGLRVSSSSFIGCQVAIETSGSAGIVALQELYVSCSQFLFNVQRDPLVARECVGRPTLCASALRYNSIISEQTDDARVQTTSGTALRRLLRQGSNHVENGRKRTDYVYYGTPTHLRFEDDQGRFDGVSAVLIGESPAAFVLASYAPIVDACFSIDSLGASASIVSDVFEVRSDKLLHTDDALSVRFRTKDRAFAKTPIAIYTVAHLGAEAVLWTAVATSTLRPEYNNWVLDATLSARDASADKHAHRTVVVALGTPSDTKEQSAQNGVAASTVPPRVIAKRLCVVCNEKGELPPRLLDQFCDGSSDNVRTSFDATYDELGFGRGTGAPHKQIVSIYLYGECSTERCTVPLDHNEHLEGTSSEERATLRSTATKCAEQSAFIDFLSRASPQSSVRNLLIEHAPGIDCAIGVQPSTIAAGPVIAYNTISGALCVDGRSGGLYVNNDIAAPDVAVYIGGQFAAREPAPIVFEANTIVSGNVVIDGAAESAATQAIALERVAFSTDSHGVFVHGSALALSLTDCSGLGRLDASGADDKAQVIAIDNEWATGAVIALRGQSLLSGSRLGGAAVHITDQVRLNDVRFDSKSTLSVDDESSAVSLVNVHFETIGRSLYTVQPFAVCRAFELAVTGIELDKSTVYDAAERQILKPSNARAIAADDSAYWSPAGELARCADGATVVRNEKECGCPDNLLVAEPDRDTHIDNDPPAAIVNEDPIEEEEETTTATPSDDDDDASSSALWWILGVAAVVLLLCAIGVCVFAAYSSDRPATPVPATATVQSSARPEESETDSEPEHDPYNLVVRRRKSTANKKHIN